MMCPIFYVRFYDGKILIFEEGYNKYLENCRQRNLRGGTFNHYRQSYVQFFKFFDPNMPIGAYQIGWIF